MADKRLSVIITGNAQGAQRAMSSLEKSAAKSGKRTESALSGIAGGLADIGVAAAAFSAFAAFDESQRVARQTEAVIRSTGGAANVTAGGVADLAGELSKKAAVDDELIQSGANVIATFTKIRNEAGKGNDIFNQATEAALDLSVAMGTDMKSASILVGKALNDPIKGITAMTRAGVSFTAQQKEQITTLANSGRTLEAQKLILKELETQFGGSAEAQATSLGRAKVAVGNLAESVGGVLAPALEAGSDAVSGAADAFGELSEGAQQAVVGGAAVGYAALRWGPQILGAASAAKTAGGNMVAFGQLAAEAVRTRPTGVTKTTAALETLSTTAPKATRAMKLLGVGFGALGALAVAYELYRMGEAMGEVEVDANKLLGATNRQLVEGARALEAMGAARDAYRQAGDQDITTLYKLRDALKAEGESTKTVDAAIKEAEGSKRRASAATNQYAREVEGLGDVQDEAGASTDVWRANAEAAAQTISDYRDRQREATDALRDFYNLQTASSRSTMAVEASLDSFSESVAENGRTLDEGTEQGRANKSALLDIQEAAVAAAIAVKEQGGSNTEAANTLQGYAMRLADTAKKAGYSEDEIRWMIATMKLTPRDIKTQFRQNAPEAEDKVSSYRRIINGVSTHRSTKFDVDTYGATVKLTALERKMATIALHGGMAVQQFRAKGGPVSAGQPYIVGEEGPELIVPKSDGMVLTAGQTKRAMSAGSPMAAAAGGSGAVYVTVNVAGSVLTGDELAEKVRDTLIDRGRRTGRPIFAGLA